MATLDVTEKVNVLVDAIGWEGFCEELMARMPAYSVTESARGGSMTLGELFEETYIQGEIAIRSYDSTGTTIEHYLGDAEEFYPDEHPQILEREVGYIFPLMEVEPTICIELKNEEDEG